MWESIVHQVSTKHVRLFSSPLFSSPQYSPFYLLLFTFLLFSSLLFSSTLFWPVRTMSRFFSPLFFWSRFVLFKNVIILAPFRCYKNPLTDFCQMLRNLDFQFNSRKQEGRKSETKGRFFSGSFILSRSLILNLS